jgi:hypothetical protein
MIVGTEFDEGPGGTRDVQTGGQGSRAIDAQACDAKQGKGAQQWSQSKKQDTRTHFVHATGQSSETGPLLAVAFSGGMVAVLGLGSLIR